MNESHKLVEDYRDDQWSAFQAFVKKQFHDKYILSDKTFFDWQYKDNPYNHGSAAALKVLTYQSKMLGYLGLIPSELSVNGDIIGRAGALCNLMISASCRVFGLGSHLITAAMNDYDVLWGTGYHPKTGPMYLGLGGWKLAGDLNRYVKVLDRERVGKMMGRNAEDFPISGQNGHRTPADISVRTVKSFDDNIGPLWRRLSLKYPVTVARTKEYLKWRYVDHPYFTYRILIAENEAGEMIGYLVFRLAVSTGSADNYRIVHILDLIAEDRSERALIEECYRLAIDEKAELIDYFSTGLFHRQSFFDSGFVLADTSPFDQIPIYFNPISLKRSKINLLFYFKESEKHADVLSDSSQWYITKGDGDKDRPNPV